MRGVDNIALLASADLTAAEVSLAAIPNDDPGGCFAPVVLDQIRAGTATLLQIFEGETAVGFTVYKIETFAGGHREMVSIATRTTSKRPLRMGLNEHLCELARLNNCQSIRMHTVRHGLVRAALSVGWHTAEIVLRKNLV
jgi:hypothetical protein